MKKLLISCAAMALPLPAMAATYVPTGVQTNVAVSTVTDGGWTLCYNEGYGRTGTSISSILAGCGGGTNLMLAARVTGSSTLLLLAQAPVADVTFNTGTSNTTHNANGVEWYYSGEWSWGFAPGGTSVNRNSCDINDLNSAERLCWHTGANAMNGGWRAGATNSLNGDNSFEKLIFVNNGLVDAVPEPATWAMTLIGFGAMGVAMRRKRKVRTTVSFA